MKQLKKNFLVLDPIARRVYRRWINPLNSFPGSDSYWKHRYDAGGNSGKGSYNLLAEFKAEILNHFVYENVIASVIEYGCGDGNQLSLARYPEYLGFDVSPRAITLCSGCFSNDKTKSFKLIEAYGGETAELTLSLDVIYHLTEDHVFADYLHRLFDSAEKFVVIYSSDTDENPANTAMHIRHRNFSKWIAVHKKQWQLLRHIPNKYPYNVDSKSGSFADFYIYVNTSQGLLANKMPATRVYCRSAQHKD